MQRRSPPPTIAIPPPIIPASPPSAKKSPSPWTKYIDYGMVMACIDTIIDVNIVEYKRFDGTTSTTMPDCFVIDGER
jgi:hypothetical protein